jgi:nucleotide-binding universal stress UspA family protein
MIKRLNRAAPATGVLNRRLKMKVLIGYDGSPSSDEIFDDLRFAGLPAEGEARVVSVADLLQVGPPVTESEMPGLTARVELILKHAEGHRQAVIGRAEAAVDTAVERVRESLPGWSVEGLVETGAPAWTLLDAAETWNADLIIVGSQGRSALGRVFLGSVSKKVATDARCSVRVVRSFERDADQPPRVVIGVDGSPAAEEAIYAVGHRVWPSGTEVRLVSVDDITPPAHMISRLPQAAAMINSYFAERETRVASMLDWAAEQLGAIGLDVSVTRRKGVPKDVMLEEAAAWNADSIFVGSRDFKSAFERFRLGSVSTAVVTNAGCPVEIVRPPANEGGE